MEVLAYIVTIILVFLGGLHFYWAIFGIKDITAVVPIKSNSKKVVTPGKPVTIMVGLVLLSFGYIVLDSIVTFLNWSIFYYLRLAISILFIIRAIGDFKYLGFFKTQKNSKFARNDSNYYSPLCLFIGLSIGIIALWG